MKIDTYTFSAIGGRKENEDSAGSKICGDSGIFVVADGLGGHKHGRLASECVVNTLLESWSDECNVERSAWLKTAIYSANKSILQCQKNERSVMKSTVVALTIDGENAVFGNTGDSRLYYIHNGKNYPATEDHSVSYKKYKAGEITREQISYDEDQSCLLKALGGEERWEPDIKRCSSELVPGDAFLLCSDGFWEYVRDEEMLIDYHKAETAQEWAELMLQRAIDRVQPGNDNMTLITVMIG